MGPSGIERPIVRDSRIVGWCADWKDRKYPLDMAGFGFNAALLSEITGDLWAYQGHGGETKFVERLIGSADRLELLCNNCRDVTSGATSSRLVETARLDRVLDPPPAPAFMAKIKSRFPENLADGRKTLALRS